MSGKEKITEQEVPMRLFALSKSAGKPSVDMNQVVGKCDILMICLDTLRYDVAHQEESAGNTPVLNRYGTWEKCQFHLSFPSCHVFRFFPLQIRCQEYDGQRTFIFSKSNRSWQKDAGGGLWVFWQYDYGRAGKGWL